MRIKFTDEMFIWFIHKYLHRLSKEDRLRLLFKRAIEIDDKQKNLFHKK